MNFYHYLDGQEYLIKKELEDILRHMCSGKNYREWSEDMIDKLYKQIHYIMEVDLHGHDGDVDRLIITEDMVITAMMMCLNED